MFHITFLYYLGGSREVRAIKREEVREGEKDWHEAALTFSAHIPVTDLQVCMWGWAMCLTGAFLIVPPL